MNRIYPADLIYRGRSYRRYKVRDPFLMCLYRFAKSPTRKRDLLNVGIGRTIGFRYETSFQFEYRGNTNERVYD